MRSWMIAYIAGVLLFHLWGEIIPIFYLITILSFSIFSFIFLSRVRWIVTLVLIFSIGVAWASTYSDNNKSKVISETFEAIDLVATGYICSIPKRKESFTALELCNATINIQGKPERRLEGLRLKLNWFTKEDVQLKGINTFDVRLKKPHGMVNPSGFLYEKWLFRKGIHGVGYIKRAKNINAHNKTLDYFCSPYQFLCHLTAFRIQINEYLSGFEKDFNHIPVIKALSIGYRGDIPEPLWALFKNTGTQHLMAISGLHVGLVFGTSFGFFSTIFKLLKFTLTSRLYSPIQRHEAIVSVLLSCIMAFCYSALAGFSVSTQRALLMIFVFVICRLLRVGLSANMRLMIAAVIILIIDPNSVMDYGFWLSFLAVWTLFLVAPNSIRGESSEKGAGLNSWILGLKSAIKMQWVIGVGLCPVLLASGMGVSYTSMLANFVAIPLVGLLTVPFVFISLITAPLSSQLSYWSLQFADVSLIALYKYLNLFSEYAGISLHLSSLLLIISVSIITLFILVFPLWRTIKCWAILTLVMLIGFKIQHLNLPETELIVLDVGQGLSVVAINGDKAVVYDTGPEYVHGSAAGRSLIPFLQSRGVKNIEMLVLSHGDADHAGGLGEVNVEFNMETVISGEPERLQSKIDATECINNKKVETSWYKAHFYYLAEPLALVEPKKTKLTQSLSSNNHSCVLRLQFDRFSVLLMGDLEKKAEKELVMRVGNGLSANVLVAGHHGSKNATGYRLLYAADPDVVIFSAGYKSRFNHPHKSTIARVVNYGAEMFNTALDGAIIISLDESGDPHNKREYKVERQRALDDAFWMF